MCHRMYRFHIHLMLFSVFFKKEGKAHSSVFGIIIFPVISFHYHEFVFTVMPF